MDLNDEDDEISSEEEVKKKPAKKKGNKGKYSNNKDYCVNNKQGKKSEREVVKVVEPALSKATNQSEPTIGLSNLTRKLSLKVRIPESQSVNKATSNISESNVSFISKLLG